MKYLILFFLIGGMGVNAADKNFHFEVGPEFVHVKLYNKATPTAVSTRFQGNLWGPTAVLEYKMANGIYFNINGANLQHHISGSHLPQRHFREQRIEGRIGWLFVCGEEKKWKIIPYTGFGWGRITQSNVGPLLATTKTPTYYVPIGLIVTYVYNDNFLIGTNLKWTPQVNAFYRTSLVSRRQFYLKNKDGFVWEVPLTYIYKTCDLPFDGTISFIPYWRFLKKGTGHLINNAGVESQIAGQIYHYLGAKLTLGVNF